MTYETDTVTTDELDEQQDYFERLYLLQEVGELRPEQMMEDEVVSDHTDHAEQVAYDLERLERTVDELPDEYGRQFWDIEGFSRQLDDIRELDPDAATGDALGASEVVDQVEEYVEESIDTDEELGYDPDNATRLFYAKHWEHHLKQNHKVAGPVDPTYVIDLLE